MDTSRMTKSYTEFLAEASLSRIIKHLDDGKSIATLTAYRGDKSKAENTKRNKVLFQQLKQAGYGFFKIKGDYTEKDEVTGEERKVKEISVFAISNETGGEEKFKKLILSLGKKFEQDTILYKDGAEKDAYLIGTSKDGWPGMGKKEKLGKFHVNRMSEFMSSMYGNGTFIFENN